MLAELQRRMAEAVHGDAAAFEAVQAGVRPAGIDPRKRLYLHRNTVRTGLLAVLREAYPVTAQALGETAFDAAATAFLQARPPRRAVLSAYGAGFPDFLDRWCPPEVAGPSESGPPARLAALDWAAHAAYFAAECVPLSGAMLAALEPEAQARQRLHPVPSATLLPTDPSTWSFWQRHADGEALTCDGAMAPTAVLVWRDPLNRVSVRALSEGEAVLLKRLFAGETLLHAAEAASAAEPALELPTVLAVVLAGGVFAADGRPPADAEAPAVA